MYWLLPNVKVGGASSPPAPPSRATVDRLLKNRDASIYHALLWSVDCFNLNEIYPIGDYQKTGSYTGSQW